MPVPVLPLEVWDNIISQIAYCNRVTSTHDNSERDILRDYAACAATCRLLAALARPHLFHAVTLSTKPHAETLAQLVTINPQIAQCIKSLTLRNKVSQRGVYGNTLSLLHIRLGTEAGKDLLDLLTSVSTLTVAAFKPPRDGTAIMSTFLAKGWVSLLRLHSIASLKLQECDLPSQTIFDIFSVSYPKLHTVNLSGVCLVPGSEITLNPNPPEHIVNAKLRKLDFWNDYPSSGRLYNLLGSMHCNLLTHLTLPPFQTLFQVDGASYTYAQPLLLNAPVLTSLTFTGCDCPPTQSSPLPRLTANVAIEHFCFHELDENLNPTWIPDILATLTNPSQVHTLEMAGNSLYPAQRLGGSGRSNFPQSIRV